MPQNYELFHSHAMYTIEASCNFEHSAISFSRLHAQWSSLSHTSDLAMPLTVTPFMPCDVTVYNGMGESSGWETVMVAWTREIMRGLSESMNTCAEAGSRPNVVWSDRSVTTSGLPARLAGCCSCCSPLCCCCCELESATNRSMMQDDLVYHANQLI